MKLIRTEAPQILLLRHSLFEEANLQLVAKLHEVDSWMFRMKLIQVDASPRGKHIPEWRSTIEDNRAKHKKTTLRRCDIFGMFKAREKCRKLSLALRGHYEKDTIY